jgi:hypothetical protein
MKYCGKLADIDNGKKLSILDNKKELVPGIGIFYFCNIVIVNNIAHIVLIRY